MPPERPEPSAGSAPRPRSGGDPAVGSPPPREVWEASCKASQVHRGCPPVRQGALAGDPCRPKFFARCARPHPTHPPNAPSYHPTPQNFSRAGARVRPPGAKRRGVASGATLPSGDRGSKTNNTGDSHVVTHRSTSPAITCLYMAERTGCLVLTYLWSFVLGLPPRDLYTPIRAPYPTRPLPRRPRHLLRGRPCRFSRSGPSGPLLRPPSLLPSRRGLRRGSPSTNGEVVFQQIERTKRAYAQQLVTTRLLDCLHDPVRRPSRLQGIHPSAL